MSRTTRINPIAKTLLQNRLFKPQQKPSGKDYNRQKDEKNASKYEKDAYKKSE
jgi:hypothetical protein